MPDSNNCGTLMLRSEIKALTTLARSMRKEEQHQLNRIGRKLRGIYSKRHRKDAPKPEAPREFKLPDNAEKLIDDAYMNYWNLHHARTSLFRKYARNNHLAYNFLRGDQYEKAEAALAYSKPDFDSILKIVLTHLPKLGDNENKTVLDEFEKWKTKALTFLDSDAAV